MIRVCAHKLCCINSPRYLDHVWAQKPQLEHEHPQAPQVQSAGEAYSSDLDDSDYVQSETKVASGSSEGDQLMDGDLDIPPDQVDGVPRASFLAEQELCEQDEYPAIKMNWEEFVEDNPMIPSEYSPEIFRVLIDELEVRK